MTKANENLEICPYCKVIVNNFSEHAKTIEHIKKASWPEIKEKITFYAKKESIEKVISIKHPVTDQSEMEITKEGNMFTITITDEDNIFPSRITLSRDESINLVRRLMQSINSFHSPDKT